MHSTSIVRPLRHRARTRTRVVIATLALNSTCALAAGPFAYVPAHDTSVNTFSVVDLSNKTVSAPITVSLNGDTTGTTTVFFGVALSRATGMLFISDDGHTESVFQIDTTNNTTVKEYFVGDNPRGMAVEPNGKHVYVAQFNGTGVSIIDTSKTGNAAVSQVDFANLSGLAFAKPYDVKLNPAGTVAYVTDASVGQRLCRFSTASPPASVADADCVAVGADPNSQSANPNALAVSPDGTRVYVVNHSESSVSVVDTMQVDPGTHKPVLVVLRTFGLGFSSPNGIAINLSGKRAYVGTGLGHILSIDLRAAENTQTNPDPVVHDLNDPAVFSVQGMAISLDGTRLLAADADTDKLHFINIVNDVDAYDTSVNVSGGPVALGEIAGRDGIFAGSFEG
jgi:DNA-binding beta-propeller fold protein YncE